MEKARLENEGTLGLRKIIKREVSSGSTQGLGKGLKRMSTANSALTASPQVKVFLDEVAEDLTLLDKSDS
jgi:hypothetical protein